MRPLLLLTGGPGAGKTTCGRRLAESRERCAFVDTDDVRRLVVRGGAAPWDGPEGERQRELGAAGAAALACGFRTAGFETVVADVLTPASLRVWRAAVPEVLVVRLVLGPEAALARLGGRHPFITEDELTWTHGVEAADPPDADAVLEVADLSLEEQVARLESLWAARRGDRPSRHAR